MWCRTNCVFDPQTKKAADPGGGGFKASLNLIRPSGLLAGVQAFQVETVESMVAQKVEHSPQWHEASRGLWFSIELSGRCCLHNFLLRSAAHAFGVKLSLNERLRKAQALR
jgi:hypothetical protein